MSDTFLILEESCDEAEAWVVRQINLAGLKVLRTFDLQATHLAHSGCPCPHHGTDQCDCQMVVLLVYGGNVEPISLIIHSHDGKTWFSLVDTPQQRADPHLETAIRQSLATQNITYKSKGGFSHAA